ncbi:MAG: Crp/Fnr family transcriptional regulator [Campylobacterales bacterium]|nr:Crp/Fnr family transcriptional regulator [Campylobacterales bacterium]
MDKYIDFLKQHLDLNTIESALAKISIKEKKYKKGEMIFLPEYIHDAAPFLADGLARGYYIDENGKETTWHFYFNDEYSHLTNFFVIDYHSFIYQVPSKIHFEAVQDCTLYFTSKKDLELLQTLSKKWLKFSLNIAELAYSFVHEKYFSQITQSADARFEFIQQTMPHILDKVPQYQIASYIGITPQHLSRLKKQYKN